MKFNKNTIKQEIILFKYARLENLIQAKPYKF